MHPGYDNFWMRNREENAVPNLPRNDNLNEGASMASNVQCGSEIQKNLTDAQRPSTSRQDLLNILRGSSEYNWRGNLEPAASSSTPFNFLGRSLQQYGPRGHWQNLGSRHLESRSSVPQSSNYMYQGRNSTTQTARIRVRDVDSLNSIAQNPPAIDRELEWHLHNVNKHPSQRDYSQLMGGNRFRPPFQKTRGRQPGYQERCPSTYVRPRGQILSNRYHMGQPYRRKSSNAVLEEMLIMAEKKAALKSTEIPRTKESFAPSSVNKDNLNQPGLQNYSLNQPGLEDYSLNQPLFERQLPYEGPASTSESSSHVTAVISYPGWCGGLVLNKLPVQTEALQRDATESEISDAVKNNDVPIEVRTEDVSMKVKTENAPIEEPTEDVAIESSVQTENVPIEIKAENPPSSVFTSTGANAAKNDDAPNEVKNKDAPDNSLKVKEEPTTSPNFCQDNTLEIVIQNMKTEDPQEQRELVTQNRERISNENTPTSPAGRNNNENDNENSETDNSASEEFSTGTDTTDTSSEESSSSTSVGSPTAQPSYKSKINRKKLDMLIDFIMGSDRRENKDNERKTPVKEKQSKSSSEKNNSPEKDPLSTVFSKVPQVKLTRLTAKDLEATKCDDSARKTNKGEHPAAKKQSKEMESADKASAKSEHKKLNRADSQNPKDAQESHPKRNPEPINKDPKRKPETREKTENKSTNAENETQVAKARRNSESSEKGKKLKTDKKKTEADANLETADDRLQQSDSDREEKPAVQQTSEIANTEIKGPLDIKKEREEEDQPRHSAAGCKTVEFTDIKKLICERCLRIKFTPFIWMNMSTGNLICSECLKKKRADDLELILKPSGNVRHQEAQTECSPVRKIDSESQTAESDAAWLKSASSSDDKKSQRRHSTGNKECHREKRRSLDERAEKKMKRRESDEKRKIKEPSLEALASTSKVHCPSEGTRSEKTIKKDDRLSRNPPEHFRAFPSADVHSTLKLLSKTETNPETAKKRVSSTEDLRSRKIQIIEDGKKSDLVKAARKTAEVCRDSVDAAKKSESSRSEVDHRKHGKETMFWCGTSAPFKEDIYGKAQLWERTQDQRKKHRSTSLTKAAKKDDEEKKKRTIKGPLQYRDFVLKRSPKD